LLVEYKQLRKANTFIDRRFGGKLCNSYHSISSSTCGSCSKLAAAQDTQCLHVKCSSPPACHRSAPITLYRPPLDIFALSLKS
jgi:hypothetical protein